MAKYAITHACGHTVTHQLYGKHKGFGGRDSKIEWLGTVPCLDCKRAEEAKQREETNMQAAEANAARGYAPLTGSPKQVAWAETIRLRALTALTKAADHPQITKWSSEARRVLMATLSWSGKIDSARWWIDHRDPPLTESGVERQMGTILSMMSPSGQRSPQASDVEIVRYLLTLSPHMTDEAALELNLHTAWTARLQAEAKQEADRESLRDEAAACEALRAAGLTGTVRVWSNARGDRRVYTDGDYLTYHYAGRDAGKLTIDRTGLDGTTVRSVLDKLCRAWERNTFRL